MRFLQINAVNVLGSTGRTAVELSDRFRALGHECLTLHSQGPATAHSVKMGTQLDVKRHGLLARVTGLQGYWSTGTTASLLSTIDQFEPDVVRLGNLHGNFVNVPMLLRHLADRDIATAITLDDCWFYTGKCTHYTVANCGRWTDGCGQCPLLRSDTPSWFFDQTHRMRQDKEALFGSIRRLAVVGVSDWITSEANKSLLRSAKIIRRIYNWIDLDSFRPLSSNIREELGLGDSFVILCVASRWNTTKGIQRITDLAKALPPEMRIVVVGDVPKTAKLERGIVRIGGTSDVSLLARLYSTSDVFLNLSEEESFGKVSAEALACGTPVISSRSTANPEIIGPGCGAILNDLNTQTIMNALVRMQSAMRGQTRDECRDFAVSRFSVDAGVAQYESLCNDLIGAI